MQTNWSTAALRHVKMSFRFCLPTAPYTICTSDHLNVVGGQTIYTLSLRAGLSHRQPDKDYRRRQINGTKEDTRPGSPTRSTKGLQPGRGNDPQGELAPAFTHDFTGGHQGTLNETTRKLANHTGIMYRITQIIFKT